MATDSSARNGRPGRLRLPLVAAGVFVAVFLLVNAALAALDLPDYGGWTGIRPLEGKLHLLEEFSSRGEVDALALGSSIADFGFSAELFSQLMSKELGREYRVFNFATGGAEPRTYPKLYRLARLVSKPRSVFVLAPPEQRLVEETRDNSPDHFLEISPVGDALARPALLPFSRALYRMPVFRYAPLMRDLFQGRAPPAVRDFFLFRGYGHLQSQVGMDNYRLSPNGDRVSYTFTWKPDLLASVRDGNERVFAGAPKTIPEGPDQARKSLEAYFAKADIDAMTDLRELVERDGGKIYLVAHAGSATLWGGPSRNERYVKARQGFYRAFAAQLHAQLWNVVDAPVAIPLYGIADATHLNAYGAEMYTRLAFAAATGRLAAASAELGGLEVDATRLERLSPSDPSFNILSAVLVRPAGEATPLLKVRLVDEPLAVPALPKGLPFFAGLRMPDGSDVIAPANPIGPSDFVAEVNLPPSPRQQVIVLRLMYPIAGGNMEALGNPIADYEWLRSYPRTPLAQQPPAGSLRVLALPPERVRARPLYIAVAPTPPAGTELGLRLVPRQGGGAVDLGTVQAAEFLKVPVPGDTPEGWYELQVSGAKGGAPIGRSAPVEILATERVMKWPTLAMVGQPDFAKSQALVSWSGIPSPSPRDWIGLFPAGGDAGTRVDVVFTGGGADGKVKFTIPARVLNAPAADTFEFRLYAADTWRLLARTPVAFVRPDLATAKVWLPAAPRLDAPNVLVKWTGISSPEPHDWIGLFPAGGDSSSRLDVVFTGGAAQGEMKFPIVSPIVPQLSKGGPFEFRLYAGGGWRLLASTPPVVFEKLAPASVK